MSDLQAPADLTPFEVLFDSSEPNPALPDTIVKFAGNLGFPPPPPDRPWIYSNFAQSLDGMVTFGGKHPEGRWIAQSRHDRWMMDLLRAHADAVLYGSSSLVQETLYSGIRGGPVFRITDPDLLRLRHERLGRGKQKNIVVTGSGMLKISEYRLFQSQEVEAWIATAPEGLKRLGDHGDTPVLVFGQENLVDLGALLRSLREEHGVQYLLCEGGPTLYGHMVRGGWMDEKFLTIAPQEIGPIIPESDLTARQMEEDTLARHRLTTITGTGFSIETARWYRWLSCRRAGDHEFNRYRFVRQDGARKP
ncbi:MAG: dihydrofolate reductase family protein [Acidobacteria bacterium]|nr:dihydrofolate reductase family protein [Acidobacteriota bacterium]